MSIESALAFIFFLSSLYYTTKLFLVDEIRKGLHNLITYLKNYSSTGTFRQKMKNYGLTEFQILQLSIITDNSISLYSKFSHFFNSHPQCPITLEEIIDETNHIKPNMTAVVEYDQIKGEVHCTLFATNALERWLDEKPNHPLTRRPISDYHLLNIS
jgi:hypothetical protein